MKFSILLTSIFIILGFILCTAISIIINPHIFTSFFSNSPSKLFYDIEHYANLSLNQACGAFYPLWPWLINRLGNPQTVYDAAFYFRVGGLFLALLSIPIFLWLLSRNIKSYKIVALTTALYAINPLSIFRVIGYTEAIFCILSLILLILISDLEPKSETFIKNIKFIYLLIFIFILSLLISLTRPFLIQAIFASMFALGSILLITKLQNQNHISFLKIFKTYSITTLVICVGALVGYCIYGYYCLGARGDFFAPFHDQKNWGKQLGFYPQLFFIPLTLADYTSIYLPFIALLISWLIFISINIRKLIFVIPKVWQFILLLAYPPAFLAFYGFDFKIKNFSDKPNNLKEIHLTESASSLSNNYVFWFCLYFALIHSIIIVFSDEKLTSLRRFIFGTPYFFLVIAYISQCFPTDKVSIFLLWMLAISGIGLVQYWLDYANYLWIG